MREREREVERGRETDRRTDKRQKEERYTPTHPQADKTKQSNCTDDEAWPSGVGDSVLDAAARRVYTCSSSISTRASRSLFLRCRAAITSSRWCTISTTDCSLPSTNRRHECCACCDTRKRSPQSAHVVREYLHTMRCLLISLRGSLRLHSALRQGTTAKSHALWCAAISAMGHATLHPWRWLRQRTARRSTIARTMRFGCASSHDMTQRHSGHEALCASAVVRHGLQKQCCCEHCTASRIIRPHTGQRRSSSGGSTNRS